MAAMARAAALFLLALVLAGTGFLSVHAAATGAEAARGSGGAPGRQPASGAESQLALLDRYCVTCHNQRLRTGGLALDALDLSRVGDAPAIWERVVLKLRGGMMPPAGRPRPDRQTYDGLRAWLEAELDRAAAARLARGRVPTPRLNRAEYANAVRDLLALEVDAAALLPADDTGHGFDNLAGTLALSPVLMERYLSAARRISRLAVGDPAIGPGFTSQVYAVPITMEQNDRMSEDLPFGSRAGLAVRHRFPLDGEYLVAIRLKRSVYEYIVNLDEAHDLDLRIDGRRVARFTVGGTAPGRPAPVTFSGTFVAAGEAEYPSQDWDDYRTGADADLTVRVPVRAGTRVVGVSFVAKSWEQEGVLQPPLREYGATVTETTDTSPRPEGPGVESVAIDGPYAASGPGQTASRARIFVCRPGRRAGDEDCAREILATLARRAWRRPVDDADLAPLLGFYRAGRETDGFEAGIRMALERLLIDPEFLFRIERDPADAPPGTPYRLSDLELASRLSFFLWSSIPDDDLLDAAIGGRLSDPVERERQVRRMLADARSRALVDNFAGQWLSLRSVEGIAPDPNLFPDFDENLREALRQETERFVESHLREDRSVVDLLRADHSFLNERLARHYGIPGVTGSHYRRGEQADRAPPPLRDPGRHGKPLPAGEAAGRPARRPARPRQHPCRHVVRQPHLPGAAGEVAPGEHPRHAPRPAAPRHPPPARPPPPPPPATPPLPARGEAGEPRTVRERLARHRRNAACAVCHAPMDPLGFALENFDAVGAWRTRDAGLPVDASAVLADGTTSFDGPAGLRRVLLDRSEQFVETVAEKLLTYALGRGIEHYDRPVVRAIAGAAAEDDYRWSSLILGIVESTPFRMRRSES